MNDAYVETIDILPTILDILNIDPKVKMDGHSAFSDEVQDRDELRILHRQHLRAAAHPGRGPSRSSAEAIVERNQRLFGSGADGPGRIYRIGPHQELLGRRASAGGEGSRGPSYARDYGNVGADSDLRARARGGAAERAGQAPRDIAVAVNGRIAAVGNTFKLAEGDEGELCRDGAGVGVPQGAQPGDVFEVADGSLTGWRDRPASQRASRQSSVSRRTSGSTKSSALPICSAPSPSPSNWAASACPR